MGTHNQFVELMTQVEGRIAQLVDYEASIRSALTKIKSFDDVINSKDAKKEVGMEVDRHSLVSARLSEISINLIRVRTLRKTISSGEVPPALVPKMQVRVDRIIKDMEDLRTAYQSLENAYEARLRFYNSCTYHM